jgi:hypothetical protein
MAADECKHLEDGCEAQPTVVPMTKESSGVDDGIMSTSVALLLWSVLLDYRRS